MFQEIVQQVSHVAMVTEVASTEAVDALMVTEAAVRGGHPGVCVVKLAGTLAGNICGDTKGAFKQCEKM